MGRGRAKAKQTKVARDLKYRTFDTDFSSLERELRGNQPELESDADDEDDDEYADYADRYGVDDDEDDDAEPQGLDRRIG